ncbi:hypothetical protein ACFL0U_01375 [Pseudomonadota bacterium]
MEQTLLECFGKTDNNSIQLNEVCKAILVDKGEGIEEIQIRVRGILVGVEIYKSGKIIEKYFYTKDGKALIKKVFIEDDKEKEIHYYDVETGKLRTVHVFLGKTKEVLFYEDDGETIRAKRVQDRETERLISSQLRNRKLLQFDERVEQPRVFISCSLKTQSLSVEERSGKKFNEFLGLSSHEGILVLGIDIQMEGDHYHSLFIACETNKDGNRIFFLVDTNDTNRFSDARKGRTFTNIPLTLYENLLGVVKDNDRLIYLERQIQVGSTCLESSCTLQDLMSRCVAGKDGGFSLEHMKKVLDICTDATERELIKSEIIILSKNIEITRKVVECMQTGFECGIFDQRFKGRCKLVSKHVSSRVQEFSDTPMPQFIKQQQVI